MQQKVLTAKSADRELFAAIAIHHKSGSYSLRGNRKKTNVSQITEPSNTGFNYFYMWQFMQLSIFLSNTSFISLSFYIYLFS